MGGTLILFASGISLASADASRNSATRRAVALGCDRGIRWLCLAIAKLDGILCGCKRAVFHETSFSTNQVGSSSAHELVPKLLRRHVPEDLVQQGSQPQSRRRQPLIHNFDLLSEVLLVHGAAVV